MKKILIVLSYTLLVTVIPLGTFAFIFYEENKIINNVEEPLEKESTKVVVFGNNANLELKNLFFNKEFKKLNKYLKKLELSFEDKQKLEKDLVLNYDTFDIRDKSQEKIFNSWIDETPKEYTSYLARAIYYYNMAWLERGTRWANKTKKEQFEKMLKYLEKASDDLEKSVKLNKKTFMYYVLYLNIYNMIGEDELLKQMYDEAIFVYKDSFVLRNIYLNTLTPRWGGSYEEMKYYINSIEPLIATNGNLKPLKGAILIDKASMASLSSRYEVSNELLKEALILSGDYSLIYFQIGKNLYWQKKYKEALSYLNKAISLRDYYEDYYRYRAKVYINLWDLEKAKKDILYSYSLNSTNASVKKDMNYIARVIYKKATKLRLNYDTEEALKLYLNGIEIDENNSYLYNGIARVYLDKQDLSSALIYCKDAIKKNPNEINHYLLIDYILTKNKNWDSIIKYWDKFIYLNPKNSRAYLERGGAYYQKRDYKKAVENAKISMNLGNSKGKETYERYKHLSR